MSIIIINITTNVGKKYTNAGSSIIGFKLQNACGIKSSKCMKVL